MLKRFLEKRVDQDWLHTNFPCMMACPAHTNAGRYVSLIAEGRPQASTAKERRHALADPHYNKI